MNRTAQGIFHFGRPSVALLAISIATFGCSNAAPPDTVEPRTKPEVVPETLPTMPDDHPNMDALGVLSRGPRRMSVEQLERAIERVADLPEGSVVIPPDLAITLGRPDYAQITQESLEPSPLFMKFMMDLGAIACTNLGDLDPGRPIEERLYTRHSDPNANIRDMLVRFTGIDGDAADPYVTRLREVFEIGRTSPRPLGGYEAVCLAIFTSPEFLLY